MATQGPFYPANAGVGFIDVSTGENADAWVSPTNVGADDATEASITAATFDSPDVSRRLQCWAFGFTIPGGATIDGITVEIDRRSIIAGSGKDFRVQLSTSASTTASSPPFTGTNKADTSTTWPSSSTVATYGGASDTWSASPTDSMVNDTNFGVLFSGQALIANADIGCDFIRMTINYTAGGGAASLIYEPGMNVAMLVQ